MSAASVLTSFGPSAMPGPVMTDVAMRFYISHSPPPLRSFISSYGDMQRAKNRVNQSSRKQQLYKPLRPCLSGGQHRTAGDGSHVGWSKKKPLKKRVVFADTKGLSLTAICVFSKFDDEPFQNKPATEELQFDITDLEAATMDLKISSVRSLELDFKQPSADYLDFRNCLIRNGVSLENCSLQERSLTGTVKVRNVGYEKSVRVRVTYDSWTTFTDVDCSFLNNVYGCQDTDSFAFEVELPAYTPPQHRIEFCVCFEAQGQTYWDNNGGRNYPLKHIGWNGEEMHKHTAAQGKPSEHKPADGKVLELEFDQFGSPRMSSGLFPGWQSWGHIDNTVPYW